MKYLLTGGAGFIGSALARRLTAEGSEVVILDNLSSGKQSRLDGFPHTLYPQDVRDLAAVRYAARSCDCIIHLAYIQGTKNFYHRPFEILDNAITGMQSVLNACAQGRKELILVSSAEAHQSQQLPTPEDTPLTVPDVFNPRFSYGGGKITCELLGAAAAHEGFLERFVTVRPHNVIGPDMCPDHILPDFCYRMNDLVKTGPGPYPFPVQGTGGETRSYTYIEDAVEQLMLILRHGQHKHAYNIGSDEEHSTREVAEAVAACYGKEIEVIPGPLRKGSPLRRRPSLDFVSSHGYKPSFPFRAAIALTVEGYRE